MVHEEKSPMQKHNEYVDKVKDTWAAEHGIPLIRIWEHDINDNPGKETASEIRDLEVGDQVRKGIPGPARI